MKFRIAKVIGFNTDQQASLAYFNLAGEENIFLGILSLTCDDAFSRGRQLLSELADEYFESEGSGENLEKIFTKALENLKTTDSFNLLLAVVSGKALYLLGHGKIVVFLKRNGSVKPLLTAGSGQLISGFLNEGDRVLLATQNLIDKFSESLSESFDFPFDAWEDEMFSRLTSQSQEMAGLLLEAQVLENIEIPPLVSEVEEKDFFETPEQAVRRSIKIDKKFKLGLLGLLALFLLFGIGLIAKNKLDERMQTQLQKQQEQKKVQELEAAKFKTQANFTLFLDLELIKKGLSSKYLSLSGERILVLDLNSKTLVVVDLSKKSHQILAGAPALGEATVASINGESAFIYSRDKGITRVDVVTQKVTSIAKADKEFGIIYDIIGFGGNVYVLDSKGQIWKYVALEGGYSDKREYLSKGVKADFSNVLRMQIESSVYVLKSGGEILRYTRGSPDHFSIGGLDRGIKDPKSFFVSSDTDNLYVLDSSNSRLVVLSKTGEFKEQYQGDKFGVASDLVVDEENKKVYLLEGSKIYVTDIK